jgi:hypothetical protein
MVGVTRKEDEEGFEITEGFREALGKWLDQPGHYRDELAAKVGCSGPLISQIRSGQRKRTSLLPKICEHTGIPFPHPHLLVAQLSREIDALMPGWSAKELAHLQETLKLLRGKKA